MTNDYTNIVDMDLYKQARAINGGLTKVHAPPTTSLKINY